MLYDFMKAELLQSGAYAARRVWQMPLVIFAIIVITALVIFYGRKLLKMPVRRWPPIRFAVIGMSAMCTLIAFRLISFHPIDQILYGLRLNWVLDPGLTVLVMVAAFWSIRQARQRP